MIGFRFLPSEEITIEGIEDQLRRSLDNLVDNAIKFTPEDGEIRVGVRKKGLQVELWVQDNGLGIVPEDLPHLFKRFHRA